MADSKIIIEVGVQGDAEVQLKKIGQAAEDAADKASKGFGSASRIFDIFAGNLAAGLAEKALEKVAAGFEAVVDFVGESIHAAAEAEANFNSLKFALQSAGAAGDTSAKKFNAFAESLQATTKYSDDAILSAGALIEQIAKLDEDGLEQATQAAANLSSALGIDLQTAAQAVGKVAIGEASILNKYGFELDKAASNADNFANALDFINQKFGGAAASQVNTFAGAQAQLANQFDNLKEAIGALIVENPIVIKLFQAMSNAVVAMTDYVKENSDTLRSWVSTGLIYAVEGIELTLVATQVLATGFLKLTEVYLKSQLAISSIAKYLPGIVGDTAKLTEAVAEKLLPKVQGAMEFLAGPTEKLRENLTALREDLEKTAQASESGAVRGIQAGQQEVDQIKGLQTTLTQSQQEELEKRHQQQVAAKQKEIDEILAMNGFLMSEQERQHNFSNDAIIKSNFEKAEKIAASEKDLSKKLLDIKKSESDYQRKIDQELFQGKVDTLNKIATLQTAKSKELQVIGKAAAISTATIDGVLAVQKALATFSPPFNFIMAGLVGVATAANIAKIAGVPLAKGGEVPAGYPNDTFPARLTSGETVVDRTTTSQLKNFLSDGGQSEILLAILDRIDRLETNVTVNVGSRTIIDEVRDGIRSGRVVNV